MKQLVALKAGGIADLAGAIVHEQTTTFDGDNNISDITGSQWDSETLYHTERGNWIVWHSSARQGVMDYHAELTAPKAAEWLIKCGHDVPDDLLAELDIR